MVSKSRLGVLLVVLVVIAVAAVTIAVVLTRSSESSDSSKSSGGNRTAVHGAVASDSEVCSNIGADVMRDNGTAIDVAIATLVCLGLIHPHSSGIGGGGFMLLYKRSTRTATYLDFRETAPGASTVDMFVNRTKASKIGGWEVLTNLAHFLALDSSLDSLREKTNFGLNNWTLDFYATGLLIRRQKRSQKITNLEYQDGRHKTSG